MTLFEFAWKNISRDKRNYIYYFINCVFSVFVFFLFSVLSFHPALEVIDANSSMGLTLAAGEAVSVAFSICFISYSMRCFLKNRSRQLGLITILGASKKQINRLVFMENMLVGSLSIVTGIIFGMVFSKFFLDIANRISTVCFLSLSFFCSVCCPFIRHWKSLMPIVPWGLHWLRERLFPLPFLSVLSPIP